MRRPIAALACALIGLLATDLAAAARAVPFGRLRLVKLPGIQVSKTAESALHFAKQAAERRLLALEAPLAKAPGEVKALAVRYTLTMARGEAPRLALVAFEKDGGAWYRVSPTPMAASGIEVAETRLPLAQFSRAAFAHDADDEMQWPQVQRLWLAFALDGSCEGTIDLRGAVLTDQPYRPTKPLIVTDGSPGQWGVSKDPAATAKISTPAEGPGGKPCTRLDYAFPGGRHMYVVPSTPLGEAELEGYKALRFTYKATLPRGIDGLLVMLIERDGTQYYADPAPPAAADWKTVTIPLASFQRGDWSKDENSRLDLNDVGSVAIGLHGTAAETQAKGTLWVADVQFVP